MDISQVVKFILYASNIFPLFMLNLEGKKIKQVSLLNDGAVTIAWNNSL